MKKRLIAAAIVAPVISGAALALVAPSAAQAHHARRTVFACRSEYWQLANELNTLQNERTVIAADLNVLQQDYQLNSVDFEQTMSVEMAVVNAMNSALNNAVNTLGDLGSCVQ